MKIRDLFENWGLKGLKMRLGFLEMDWSPQPEEEQAAWEMYIELITRIAVQPLSDDQGDEQAALDSIYSLFPMTRKLLKKKGRKAKNFSKIAVVVLNQIIRPFTEKWHKPSIQEGFKNPKTCRLFREELKDLQSKLRNYSGMLAQIANVEDFHALDQGPLVDL